MVAVRRYVTWWAYAAIALATGPALVLLYQVGQGDGVLGNDPQWKIPVQLGYQTATDSAADVAHKPKRGAALEARNGGATSEKDRKTSLRLCPKVWPQQFIKPNGTTKLRFGFFNRAGFNALIKEAERRKWIIEKSLKPSLMSLEKVDFIFTHPSAYTTYPVLKELKPRHHLVSAVQGMPAACGSKTTQARVLREYATKVGCNPSKMRFLPQSFILSEQKQCNAFFNTHNLLSNHWILKPASSYGGTGIEILHGRDDMQKLQTRFGKCWQWRSGRPENRFLVQEYIEKPLLLHGKKFDVRMYMFLASTQPMMLFYRPGYVRAALNNYDLKNIKDKSQHLTNTQVQGSTSNFTSELRRHFWSLDQLQDYLSKHLPGKGENFVKQKLVPFVKQASLYVFHAGRDKLVRSPGTFQLMGLDIMVDADLNCWFIEVNNYPLWPYQGKFSSELSLRMAEDAFDLVLALHTNYKQFQHVVPGDEASAFELLYSEMADCKKKTKKKRRARFNPCDAFPS